MPFNGYGKTQISASSVQFSEPELNFFSDELQKLAKDAFGVAAQASIEQFIYARMPPHLKKSKNQAHLENGTYAQIVIHLEKELELNSLEYTDEPQMNTLTHRQQIEGNQGNAGNINSDINNSNPNNNTIDRKCRTVCLTCERERERVVMLEPMQQTRHFPGRANLNNRKHRNVYSPTS